MTALLEIDGLRTHIRQRRGLVRAVDGIGIRLDAGETLGLVGESGCGKSMSAMSILRLLPPGGFIAGGSITFEGTALVRRVLEDAVAALTSPNCPRAS